MKLLKIAEKFTAKLKLAEVAPEELESFVAEEVDFAIGTLRHALSSLVNGNEKQAKASLEMALHVLRRVQQNLPKQSRGASFLAEELPK